MFLGGLWAVRKIAGLYILHGALVGFFADIFYYVPVYFLALINHLPWELPENPLLSGLLFASIKILSGALGGFVVGRLRKKQLSDFSHNFVHLEKRRKIRR